MQSILHEHIEELKAGLNIHYKLHEHLSNRIALIKNNYANKSDFEKNDIEITIIKTQAEIDSLKKIIVNRENHHKACLKDFIVDLKEVESNFDELIKTANIKKAKNTTLNEIMNNIKWDAVNSKIEVKIKLYKEIKKHL